METIGWDDFARVEIRAGIIVSVEDFPEAQRLEWFTGGFLDYSETDNRIIATDIRLGIPGAHPFTFVLANRNGGEVEPTASFRTPRPGLKAEALSLLWSRTTGETPVLCLASFTAPAPGQHC